MSLLVRPEVHQDAEGPAGGLRTFQLAHPWGYPCTRTAGNDAASASDRTVKAGELKVEAGPAADVVLQWATYFDAADQAGVSRLFGGIHIRADDFDGRKVGALCGQAAWELAQRHYAGSVGS